MFVRTLNLCILLMVAATSPCWSATLSGAGGVYITNTPSQTGAAVLISSAASVPALPIQIQATAMVPAVKQGGYAITGEVRGLSGGGFGGAYLGVGAGFGTLSTDRRVTPVLTGFVGKPIAPDTTVEIRVYRGTRDSGQTAGFVGLRFSF